MNVEELHEAFTIPADQREAFYDRLLDQLEILFFRGEVEQSVYDKYRASYLFERDGTVVHYDF